MRLEKKIVILSNSSSGLYEFRREIILDMKMSHTVYVVLPEKDKYYDLLAEDGCNMVHIPFERRGMNPIKDFTLLFKYKRLINLENPDMVCTYTIKPNIYGGIVCRMTHTPYIVNITGLGTAIQGGGLLSRVLVTMYRVATKKAKCIFFQNEYNMIFMNEKGIGKTNSRLLPGSGVNLDKYTYKSYPAETEGINILSVMRIMKDKGIEEYFEVVDKLGGKKLSEIRGIGPVGSNEKVVFTLAGYYEEETRGKYETVLNRLVEEGKLLYKGVVDDMGSLYENCHIVLHPSYHEGLSNVCLEAAACGRPVLASDIPGCRETIDDGRTGIQFEARNANAIEEAIVSVLKMTVLEREKMGLAGRRLVEDRFSREIVIDEYRKMI